jgi:hypothetical protein
MIELPGTKPLAPITRDAADPDAKAIKADHAKYQSAEGARRKIGQRIADRLRKKKEKLGHGNFYPWLESVGMPDRTAVWYMKKYPAAPLKSAMPVADLPAVSPENSPAESPESAGNPPDNPPAAPVLGAYPATRKLCKAGVRMHNLKSCAKSGQKFAQL